MNEILPSSFESLVLGCTDSYDSDQRLMLQHFSRSIEIYQDLQDLHSFAPLRPLNFSRKSAKPHARTKTNEFSAAF